MAVPVPEAKPLNAPLAIAPEACRMTTSSDDDLTWYAAFTKPGKETLVYRSLIRDGYDALLLRESVRKTRRDRPYVIVRAHYPRYVFVGVGPRQALYRVNKTEGVSSVVCSGEDALVIPNAVIRELRAKGDENGFVDTPKPKRRPQAKKGDELRILAGPFQAFLAEIEHDGGDAVKAWVEAFGRRTLATFKPADLGLYDGGQGR